MNRYEDSKIPELDHHVDNIENRMGWIEEKVRELKRNDDEIKEIKVIEMAFNDKCERGVAEVNRFLEKKFDIFWKQPTESGYVFFMAKWGLKE